MKLGEKIKYLRKSKGISQEELATMLKINRNFLSRIETGKSDPNAGILKSIAQIFNVDLNSLLDINNSEEQGIDKIKYITEKKKSILNIPSITNKEANKLYYYNRRLNVIIAIYFFINAYNNYQDSDPNDNTGERYLLAATFFILIGSLLYLPLGNSNLIIEN